ncbi:MAG: hypothetical protein FWE32_06700 [Oscillospiraceae bacterium]|nr:hypothetical protein [Oscillospiraceae bacterium]
MLQWIGIIALICASVGLIVTKPKPEGVERLNGQRAKKGKPPLTLKAHAKKMRRIGIFVLVLGVLAAIVTILGEIILYMP